MGRIEIERKENQKREERDEDKPVVFDKRVPLYTIVMPYAVMTELTVGHYLNACGVWMRSVAQLELKA